MNIDDTKNDLDEREVLKTLLHELFGGDASQAALVLGRTEDEIDAVLNGDEPLDDDLAMKIRGIARERGIESN